MTKINENIEVGNSGVKMKRLVPYILYDNSNGTTSNITLDDSIANYQYIEIYYRSNDGGGFKNSTKVHVNGITYTSLRYDHYTYGTFYSKTAEIHMNNNSLTFDNNIQTYYSNGSNMSVQSGDYIYIYKVIGYK